MMCLAQCLAHGECLVSISPPREVEWWQWASVHVCMAALWQGFWAWLLGSCYPLYRPQLQSPS